MNDSPLFYSVAVLGLGRIAYNGFWFIDFGSPLMLNNKQAHNFLPDIEIGLGEFWMMAEEFIKEADAGFTSMWVIHSTQPEPWFPLKTKRSGYPRHWGNI